MLSRALAKFTREEQELVIVGGPYKSGTSMMCAQIEAQGYQNPALFTSTVEYGHGISTGLYLTRECAITQRLNRRLVGATPREKGKIEQEIADYLACVYQHCGARIVLKDPYMKLTALVWFQAAAQMGVGGMRFCTTERDPESVRRSWKNSRFLMKQLPHFPDLFARLSKPLSTQVQLHLKMLNVEHQRHRYLDVLRNERGGPFRLS